MAELYFITGKENINFEGVFSIPELYKSIDQWFAQKGFDKNDVKNEEIVEKESKYVEILMEPWKKYTDYCKCVIRVHARIYGVKDVEVELDKHKLKLNKARALIEVQAFMNTDYEDRWDQHPLTYFFRTLYDKFFFRIYTQKYAQQGKADTKELVSEIKSFLNIYRFKLNT
jgi:hypothetical protein